MAKDHKDLLKLQNKALYALYEATIVKTEIRRNKISKAAAVIKLQIDSPSQLSLTINAGPSIVGQQVFTMTVNDQMDLTKDNPKKLTVDKVVKAEYLFFSQTHQCHSLANPELVPVQACLSVHREVEKTGVESTVKAPTKLPKESKRIGDKAWAPRPSEPRKKTKE
jgi:hypothetical protein